MKAFVIRAAMANGAEHRLQNAMGQRPAVWSEAADESTHKNERCPTRFRLGTDVLTPVSAMP